MLALCFACFAPVAALGAVFAIPRWSAALSEAWRRRRRARLPTAPGPPLERLAADLRRLRRQRADPQLSRVQREGARLAYEDVLRAAANALGISCDLAGKGGLVREVEVLRVEQALADAGVVLTPA